MEPYVLPLVALLFNFLALAACLRFLFSRQGLYWLVPVGISLILGWFSGTQLLTLVSSTKTLGEPNAAVLWVLLVLSIFWYLGVITFHYALKKTIAHNKHLDDTWKNYHEARYLEKVTFRTYRRQARRFRRNNVPGSYVPETGLYPKDWTDYIDQR